jgi:hypothetical protein
LRRVFHESGALETNATAIVTKRRSFKLEATPICEVASAETLTGRGFHGYLQNSGDMVQSQPFA